MKRLIYLLLFFTGSSLFSFEWPSPLADDKNRGLVSLEDKKFDGNLNFINSSTMTLPEEGRLLFEYNPKSLNKSLGEKSFFIVNHDNQFQTVFQGVSFKSSEQKKAFFSSKTIEGSFTYSLFVRDAKLNQIVNPFLLFPLSIDYIDPKIHEIKLLKEGVLYDLDSPLTPGSYGLLVKASDRVNLTGKKTFYPYSYELYSFGISLAKFSIISLYTKDGSFFIDNRPVGTLYFKDYLILTTIELGRQKTQFNLLVSDTAGNYTSKTFILGAK